MFEEWVGAACLQAFRMAYNIVVASLLLIRVLTVCLCDVALVMHKQYQNARLGISKKVKKVLAQQSRSATFAVFL
jgi:hypothetical protein